MIGITIAEKKPDTQYILDRRVEIRPRFLSRVQRLAKYDVIAATAI